MRRLALVLLLAVLAVPGARAQTREVRIDIAGGGRRTQLYCEAFTVGRLPAGAPGARQADEVLANDLEQSAVFLVSRAWAGQPPFDVQAVTGGRWRVGGGQVTLEGEVDSAGQRDEAARAIRNVLGVNGVLNRLTVRKGDLGATELHSAISSALQRQAAREAEHVQVDVHDGSVTLTGTIHSWSERRAIIGTIRGTPGVDVIIDELRIDR